MKIAPLRSFILTCAVITIAGSAVAHQSDTTPQRPLSTPAAESPTPADTTAASAAAPAATSGSDANAKKTIRVSKDYIKRLANIGFHPKNSKGQLVFCKKSAQLGTRFETEQCMDGEQLTMLLERTEAQKLQMQDTACAKGGLICGQAR
jgi:hypothetical protein